MACNRASADRIPNTMAWTTERCANMVFGSHVDGDGFERPTTIHKTRVVENLQPRVLAVEDEPFSGIDATAEVCTYHMGHWYIDQDGYERVMFCGQPDTLDSKSIYNGVGMAFVAGDVGASRAVEEGYEYDVASYVTPPWVEVHMDSEYQLCGQPT